MTPLMTSSSPHSSFLLFHRPSPSPLFLSFSSFRETNLRYHQLKNRLLLSVRSSHRIRKAHLLAKATSEASARAELLILQTGMTAFGKAYYRSHSDLVPHLAAKLESLRTEYLRFAVEKCSAVLREYQSAVETMTDILLEKGALKAEEIWEIYNKAPQISQPPVNPVDEHGALIYAGRWGIYGVSLPGRVSFAPGNMGFSTFGAPRPLETQIISDETWKLIDGIWDQRIKEIKDGVSQQIEEDTGKPQLLLANHFL